MGRSALFHHQAGSRREKPRIEVGRTAKLILSVAAHPVNIPRDTWVDVVEKRRLVGLKGKVSNRYRVTWRGRDYWVDEDNLAPLGVE